MAERRIFHRCPNCGQRNLYQQRMMPPHPLRGPTANFHCRGCFTNSPGQGETETERLAWAQAFVVANNRRHELIEIGFGRILPGQTFELGNGFTPKETAEFEAVTTETERLMEPMYAEMEETNTRLKAMLEARNA